MDILDVLSFDNRVIIHSSKDERSIITWNKEDTLQWWRPVVRARESDYPNGAFDPNDWEEVSILTQSGYGPKTFEQARNVALEWLSR